MAWDGGQRDASGSEVWLGTASCLLLLLFLLLFFSSFSLFLATLQHMVFPGQGSDPSCSWDLCCSCSNAGSLTHCAGLGIKPASQGLQRSCQSHCATGGNLSLLQKQGYSIRLPPPVHQPYMWSSISAWVSAWGSPFPLTERGSWGWRHPEDHPAQGLHLWNFLIHVN